MDIIAMAVALKKAISQTKDIIASHFVAGTNIEITDNPDGTQTINASGEVSATDEVARQAISDHEADVNNPHSVTKNQIGLGNVDNTSDADKPISTAAQTVLNSKQDTISDLAAIRSNATAGAEAATVVQGINETGNNYIEMKSGIREYLSTTVPTGTIPTGSVGMGFDEGVFTYKSGAKVSEGEPNLTYGKQFSFYANGQNLTDYTIYGADGGVGDRTANLFDYTKTDDIIANSFINQSGVIVTSDEYYISYPIEVNVGETYTWKFNADTGNSHTAPTVGFYDSSDNLLSTAHHDSAIRYFSFEVPTNCAYIRASVFTKDKNVQQEAMLNEGSTPLPYEPYGYKIPVICGNTTTNIYIDSPLDDGDSIDYTTSQVAIPTVDGANNLICDTTVQPSKVSLAYTGWHSDDTTARKVTGITETGNDHIKMGNGITLYISATQPQNPSEGDLWIGG